MHDREAWNRFVDTYSPYIVRWCQAMGLQDADAADATQSVLMKLIQAMRTWEFQPDRGRFRNWLRTVTHNVAVDLNRSWKERAAGDTAVWQGLTQIPDESLQTTLWDSIETAYQKELLELASNVVQLKVQPQTWAAYHETSVLGKTAREAADTLGLSVGEVYVAKSRVIKMLRSEVQRLEGDTPTASEMRSYEIPPEPDLHNED
jgi:RNA polymerase sigma-70 factor, ECF subfamily